MEIPVDPRNEAEVLPDVPDVEEGGKEADGLVRDGAKVGTQGEGKKEAVYAPFKRKRKVTQDQVLEEQYKTLLLKQENLKLQRRKLQLEVTLLEGKVNA